MWRDAGYGVGAVLIGLIMQGVDLEAAFYLTGTLMFLSGVVVYLRMEETHPDFGTHTPPSPASESEGPPTIEPAFRDSIRERRLVRLGLVRILACELR